MNTLPKEGFVRIKQIIGDPKANPPIPPIVPIGRTKLYYEMKKNRFPKGLKFGRTTVWRVEQIRDFIENLK